MRPTHALFVLWGVSRAVCGLAAGAALLERGAVEPAALGAAGCAVAAAGELDPTPWASTNPLEAIVAVLPARIEPLPLDATAEGLELARVPVWDVEHGTIDFDYWWQGTEALAARPKSGRDWSAWRRALLGALMENELTEGANAGTWPMVDAWSAPGLEAYASAANALRLYAVYEREPR